VPLYDLGFARSRRHPILSAWDIKEASRLEKKVQPIKWDSLFIPLKPKSGLLKNEWWITKDAWEMWARERIDKGVVIAPKWDGRRFIAIIDREKGTAKLITEDKKRDRADALRPIVDEMLNKVAYNKKQFFNYVRWARTWPGSEGAILEVVDSIYPAKYTGENRHGEIAKIKNLKEIDVMVWERREKMTKEGKPLGTFMYECYYIIPAKLRDRFWGAKKLKGKWVAPIGTAYGRKLRLGKGTIVTVVPVRIREYEREGKRLFTWMFPNVLEVRRDKEWPDTLTTVERLAELGTAPLPAHLEAKIEECPYWNHFQICPFRWQMAPPEASLERLKYPIKCSFAYEYRCRWAKSYYYDEKVPSYVGEELEEDSDVGGVY